jgi:hypothetical protein
MMEWNRMEWNRKVQHQGTNSKEVGVDRISKRKRVSIPMLVACEHDMPPNCFA